MATLAQLLEKLQGQVLGASEWNAVLAAVKTLVQNVDEDGTPTGRQMPVDNRLWFQVKNTTSVAIPANSLFSISGALGTPATAYQEIFASKWGGTLPASPQLICINEDEIPPVETVDGIGYARFLQDGEEVLVQWVDSPTDEKPAVGQTCGLDPDSHKVSKNRTGLICTGHRTVSSGDDPTEFVAVVKCPEPTGLVCQVSERITRFNVLDSRFGLGKVKVKYRRTPYDNNELYTALSPVDGEEWELTVYNADYTSAFEVGRSGYCISVLGVGLIFLPFPCAFVLEDCNPRDNRLPNIYASNCELFEYVDQVVKVAGYNTCWRVRLPDDSDNQSLVSDAPAQIILATYPDCTYCKACYKLTECNGGESPDIIYTNTDLARYVGKVIKLSPSEVCYTVELWTDCESATPVEFYDYYDDCTPCESCYHLTGCIDTEQTIVVTNDLARIATDQEHADPPLTPEDLFGTVFEINGVCYTVDEDGYDTDCGTAVSDATIGRYYPSCPYCGCFLLTPCDEGSGAPDPIYAKGAFEGSDSVVLRDYVGKVVLLDDGFCYTISEATGEDCAGAVDVNILEFYDAACPCIIWTLTKCAPLSGTITTYTDLAGLGFVENDTIKLDDDICYTITDEDAAFSGSVDVTPKPDTDPYKSCDACNGLIYYKLTNSCTDCEGGPRDPVFTNWDLSGEVGKQIKYDGECWIVSIEDPASGDVTVELTEDPDSYDTCDECKAASSEWEQTVLTAFRVDGATRKLQYKSTKLPMSGTSNCADDAGEWIDAHTGTACPD